MFLKIAIFIEESLWLEAPWVRKIFWIVRDVRYVGKYYSTSQDHMLPLIYPNIFFSVMWYRQWQNSCESQYFINDSFGVMQILAVTQRRQTISATNAVQLILNFLLNFWILYEN